MDETEVAMPDTPTRRVVRVTSVVDFTVEENEGLQRVVHEVTEGMLGAGEDITVVSLSAEERVFW